MNIGAAASSQHDDDCSALRDAVHRQDYQACWTAYQNLVLTENVSAVEALVLHDDATSSSHQARQLVELLLFGGSQVAGTSTYLASDRIYCVLQSFITAQFPSVLSLRPGETDDQRRYRSLAAALYKMIQASLPGKEDEMLSRYFTTTNQWHAVDAVWWYGQGQAPGNRPLTAADCASRMPPAVQFRVVHLLLQWCKKKQEQTDASTLWVTAERMQAWVEQAQEEYHASFLRQPTPDTATSLSSTLRKRKRGDAADDSVSSDSSADDDDDDQLTEDGMLEPLPEVCVSAGPLIETLQPDPCPSLDRSQSIQSQKEGDHPVSETTPATENPQSERNEIICGAKHDARNTPRGSAVVTGTGATAVRRKTTKSCVGLHSNIIPPKSTKSCASLHERRTILHPRKTTTSGASVQARHTILPKTTKSCAGLSTLCAKKRKTTTELGLDAIASRVNDSPAVVDGGKDSGNLDEAKATHTSSPRPRKTKTSQSPSSSAVATTSELLSPPRSTPTTDCQCAACQKPRCGQCCVCLPARNELAPVIQAAGCLLRCCASLGPEVHQTFADAIEMFINTRRVTRQLQPNDRIEVKWHGDGIYYAAVVRRSYFLRGNLFYSVVYDDGIKQHRVHPNLVRDMFEKELIEEHERLGKHFARDLLGQRVFVFAGPALGWGNVVHIAGVGYNRELEIWFEDDRERIEVPISNVCVEEKYFDTKPPEPKRDFVMPDGSCQLHYHFMHRCKECASCAAVDCGQCVACRFNKTESSVSRKMCLLRTCQSIPLEKRKQPMLGEFPTPWSFTVEKNPDQFSGCKKCGCPCTHKNAAGTWVLRAFCGSLSHNCIHSALVNTGYTAKKSSEMIFDFFSAKLGIEVRTSIRHELVGRGYHQRWIGEFGEFQDILGEITTCWKGKTDGKLSFLVEYDRSALPPTASASKFPNFVEVSEYSARGGAISFDEENCPRRRSTSVPPFHWKWLTPDKRSVLPPDKDTMIPKLKMIVGDFSLRFEAKKSRILNAGLGLFVQCFDEGAIGQQEYFELEPGLFLDLGRYSPLCPTDRKRMAVSHVKNFLLDRKAEEWEFDFDPNSNESENIVFDVSCGQHSVLYFLTLPEKITNDYDGEPHEVARNNVLIRANESHGKKQPNLTAQFAPDGSVHYLLGHTKKLQGPLRLPIGGDGVELMVDYGPSYEKVRVRKGYPRVTGDMLDMYHDFISREDHDALEGCSEDSAADINAILDFLESLKLKVDATTENFSKKALALVLKVIARIDCLMREFDGVDINDERVCDNGYMQLIGSDGKGRAIRFLRWVCELWACPADLKESVLSYPLLKSAVNVFLFGSKLESGEIERTCPESFLRQLLES